MRERIPARPAAPGRRALLALALLLAAATPARLPAQAADGFVPLFDGATLEGWVVENTDAGNFQVRDGVLRVEGPGGWLRSVERYGDFVLRVEFRFLTDDSDSGIFVRADGAAEFGRGWAGNSYQIQTRDVTTNRTNRPIWLGDIYRHQTPPGQTDYDREAALAATRPTGEWQEFEIEVIGDRIAVRLNGTPITRAAGIVNPTGHVGIQGETGTVEFRSFLIQER